MIAFLMVRRTPAPAEPAPQTTNLLNQNLVMIFIFMEMTIMIIFIFMEMMNTMDAPDL